MSQDKLSKTDQPVEELPDSWWYRVYAAVIVSLVLVIGALSWFSYYFSS